MKTVNAPDAFAELFEQAQHHVREYFGGFRSSPERGTLEISGQRYILVRAGAMSVEFFDVVRRLYGSENEQEGISVARSLLFDIAHSMGLADAAVMSERMQVSDPVARLAMGPVHFAHAGWAFVDILPDSNPVVGEDYVIVYDHPYSFESDAWLNEGRKPESAVCVMNAGYSSGWCEACFDVNLVATEILCRAKGDRCCRFVMAPPGRVEERIREYLARHPEVASQVTGYEVPGFFARRQQERALQERNRRVQLELEASRELRRRIVEALPAGWVSVDANGAIVDANSRAADILKFHASDLIGMHVKVFEAATIWEDGTRARAADYPVTLAIATGRAQASRTIGVEHADGTVTWSAFNAVPLKDAAGNVTGAVATFLDITESKQNEQRRLDLEKQVRESQHLESLGLIAGGVAHDFNNLLVGVLTSASLARSMVADESEVSRLLQQVERSAERATELTRELLAYAGKSKERVQKLDLAQVLGDMVDLLQASLPQAATLSCEFAKGLPAIEADIAQVKQVATNLILNAAEALGAGGRIRVSTSPLAGSTRPRPAQWCIGTPQGTAYVVLEVSDDGSGMDASTQARLFEPFFTTKFSGRGLGLAAVGGLARSNGWVIAFESTQAQGSTFWIAFPCADAPAPVVEVPAKVEGSLQGHKVLIIDDDKRVRFVLARVIQHTGCTVIEADSGEQGLELFRDSSGSIDAVLLDLTMPGMSGAETLKRLRQQDREIPVILMSGYSIEETREQLQEEASAFLSKPFKATELEGLLKEVLLGSAT